ncbi:MAG: hypothetical protein AAGI03_09135 [Pseudomonadota bacterium]
MTAAVALAPPHDETHRRKRLRLQARRITDHQMDWFKARGHTPDTALQALGVVDLWNNWEAVESHVFAFSLRILEDTDHA